MRHKLAFAAVLIAAFAFAPAVRAAMTDYPVVRLQSLDKVSARTMTFEVRVGSTVKFGSIFIKVQSCRKSEPIDAPESASFLQVWEVPPGGDSKWIFSGWMFASSPALSPMDHPIYDVWVLDCLERKSSDPVPAQVETPKAADPVIVDGTAAPGDGEVTGPAAEPPKDTAPKPVVQMPEGYAWPGMPAVPTPTPESGNDNAGNDHIDDDVEGTGEDLVDPPADIPAGPSDDSTYIEQQLD